MEKFMGFQESPVSLNYVLSHVQIAMNIVNEPQSK